MYLITIGCFVWYTQLLTICIKFRFIQYITFVLKFYFGWINLVLFWQVGLMHILFKIKCNRINCKL